MQVWDKNDWLYEGEHGFRLGYSREIQDITVCQDIAELFDECIHIVVIIIDLSMAFYLVRHYWLLMNLTASGG